MSVAVPSELLPATTNFEWISLDDVENVPSRTGIAIWRALRRDRRYPSRADLSPRRIAGLMQYMSLIQVIDGGKDFENRFVGDAVVRAHDVPIARRRFSEVAQDSPVLIEGLLPVARKVLETGAPLAYRGRTGHDMTHVIYTDFEGVMLPLGDSDGAVDHILYIGVCGIQLSSPRRR